MHGVSYASNLSLLVGLFVENQILKIATI